MELRQLKTFQKVSTLLSFNRAAEALHYAQSTVSAQIKALEDELGVPLFDRMGNQIVLTDSGERLLLYAQRLLVVEEETYAEVTGKKRSTAGFPDGPYPPDHCLLLPSQCVG